jgi:sphinganine-1-phosphate aldolase
VSWALMNYLGEEGYLRLATVVRETSGRIRKGIESTEGLKIFGDPVMSVMAFGSDDFDIFSVGDQMDARGWHLDRQMGPDALHLMVSPKHADVVEEFLDDLKASVRERGESEGKEARYA